jgi:anti-sigma-K factor RskA
MTHRHPSRLLEEYLDGSLAPDKAKEVERRLAEDETWREELRRLETLLHTLRSIDVPDPGTVYFEDLLERVEARTVHSTALDRATAVPQRGRGSESLRTLISIAFVLSLLFFSLYFANLNVDRRTQPLTVEEALPIPGPTMEDSLLKSIDELDINFFLLGSPTPIGRLGTYTVNRSL